MTVATAHEEQPQLHQISSNGIQLACHEWRAPQRSASPTLVLVHATGFHGRIWDPVIRRLPGRHVLAPDLRGHGRSESAPFANWEAFGRDLAGLASAMDVQGAIGIGHSMGAHALVQAAAFEPTRFSKLLLVDPVLQAPAVYHLPPVPAGTLHPAAGRKHHFASAQSMFDRFAARPPYAVFDREALMQYCVHGLRPAASGSGFELACAPAFEASIYPQARGNPGVVASIRALQIPVWVVRARPQDPAILPWDPLGSPTWPGLAGEFHHGRDLLFNDKTHFLPMEDPTLMARLIDELIASTAS